LPQKVQKTNIFHTCLKIIFIVDIIVFAIKLHTKGFLRPIGKKFGPVSLLHLKIN
jgi:hypothetical protein